MKHYLVFSNQSFTNTIFVCVFCLAVTILPMGLNKFKFGIYKRKKTQNSYTRVLSGRGLRRILHCIHSNIKSKRIRATISIKYIYNAAFIYLGEPMSASDVINVDWWSRAAVKWKRTIRRACPEPRVFGVYTMCTVL